jgi:hypothetical protein
MVIVGVKVKENKYLEMEGVITFCCLVDEGTRSNAVMLFFCVCKKNKKSR